MGYFSKLCFAVGLHEVGVPFYVMAKRIYNTDYDEVPLTERLQTRYGVQKKALVTGASEGIGYAFAEDLAKANFDVTLVSRSQEKLKNAKAMITQSKNQNAQCEIHPLDLSKASSEDLQNLFKRDYSVVVNNAGIARSSTLLKQDPRDMQAMMDLNMHAFSQVTKYALTNFIENPSSISHSKALVQLSSVSSHFILNFYGASKKFERSLSLVLNAQNKNSHRRIDTLVVKPHYVLTNMTDYKQHMENCYPSDTSKGALSNLGHYKQMFGSVKHEVFCNTLYHVMSIQPIHHQIILYKHQQAAAAANKQKSS